MKNDKIVNISRFDPSRETVGSIYRKAQIQGEKQLIVGDMSYELRKSLADDLNDTIKQGCIDFDGRPFYITVYEKRDLAMRNAFIRRLIKTKYRPYPEDDTLVFRITPYTNQVYFCWELPHRSNMLSMLAAPELHPPEQIDLFRKWENLQLDRFGFMKDEMGNWKENPLYQGDQLLEERPDKPKLIVSTR